MVQKHGKSGLNNGASMKFGETNYLMKRQGYKTGFFIRKMFNAGEEVAPVPSGDLPKIAGSARVRRDSDREVIAGELNTLRELEDNGSTELPMQNAKDRNPVYLSLNKHSRWDLLEKLKDHVQFQRVFEEKVQSINSPVLGITLVEKYGDYLHGHVSNRDSCSYISYESNMAAKESPVSAKGNTAYLWDLRNKSNRGDATENSPKPRKSSQHNQHFRGVQRRKSTDRKSISLDLDDTKSPRFAESLQPDCPEVLYEVTYPRPLDASSGSQDLRVRRWNWCFRDKKSRSKCKGQKISRRADYYCLSQKDLKNWKLYGDIDNEAKASSTVNNEPKLNLTPNLSYKAGTQDLKQQYDLFDFETNPYEDVDPRLYLSLLCPDGFEEFDKIMLSDHLNEEKLAELGQTSHFVTEVTHNDTECPEDYDFLTTKTRDPTFPWGTPFELSMIKVDEDTFIEDEFEFVDSPEGVTATDEFEVVENAGKVPNTVDGVLLLEKEDSGFIRVDSKNILTPPRLSLTLGDFMQEKSNKNRAKGFKNKKNLKKSS